MHLKLIDNVKNSLENHSRTTHIHFPYSLMNTASRSAPNVFGALKSFIKDHTTENFCSDTFSTLSPAMVTLIHYPGTTPVTRFRSVLSPTIVELNKVFSF